MAEPKVQEMNLIWKHTHPDYRGVIDGVRYVLVNEEGATVSVPLQSLHQEEHARMLAYAKGCEERGRRGW
jgi:hypothetical protein